ncbi:hypothetical protein DYB32_009570 [Aphanomyces invadans]|uniref:Uncharacterized protein n=1 Tax=Aphanomyces invadans TaxID=157072 RepID=A0A3R6VT40_9STRA|nr:hypothetical protein DYB32_009570 [Aphanomyces invadans]
MIMDEALALRIEHDDLMELEGPGVFVDHDSQPANDDFAHDVSSDYAVALALQLEEQTASHTIEYAVVATSCTSAPAFDSSAVVLLSHHNGETTDERADEIQDKLMHHTRPRPKSHGLKTTRKRRNNRAAATSTDATVSWKHLSGSDCEDVECPGLALDALLFVATDAYNAIAPELPFYSITEE